MTENNFDLNTGAPLENAPTPEAPAAEAQMPVQAAAESAAPEGNVYQAPTAPMQATTPPPQYVPPQNVNMDIPPEIRKWNWGAFIFNIFWGIGNKAYLPLLCLIPCFNFVWIFVCGAMGNQWAWKTGEFKDVEQFMAVQRTWNRAGFVAFIIYIVAFVLYIIVVIIIAVAAANAGSSLYNYYGW